MEVTYENTGNVYTVVQALSHRILSDGNAVAEVGDEEPFWLNPDDLVTISYPIELSSYLDTELEVESTVVYGQSATALTRLLIKKEIPVETISAEDSSRISIEKVEYHKEKKQFEISIKNLGEKEVYVDAEVVDLVINGENVTLGSEVQVLSPGKISLFIIKASLEETDFENNKMLTVRAHYGEREGILIKTLVKEFELQFTESQYQPLILLAVVIILVSMLIKLRKKRKI